MNIFFLDSDPQLAAQYQCDKHVVKMVLESAQLLSTVHYYHPSILDKTLLYKPTHANHPCTLWLRKSLDNYLWLARHAVALSSEYTFRYGKIHKSSNLINLCQNNLPRLQSIGFTIPALAMPDEYKVVSPVESYRKYYRECKLKTVQCNWTKRERPNWL